MKNVFFTLYFCTLFFYSSAEIYAVKLCDNTHLDQLKTLTKDNDGTFIAHLETEQYALVTLNHKSLLDTFCYYTQVIYLQNQFAFNTNTILIKTTEVLTNDVINDHHLTPHQFIPNVYIKDSHAKHLDDLTTAISTFNTFGWVAYAQPNQIFTIQATSNDPYYSRQWALHNTGSTFQYNGTPGADMSINDAWTITQGSPSIKVAILDSGVDTLHEDLSINILSGYDAFATDSLDTKGFPTPNFPNDGHGTACAGIVGALANNQKGIAGIANQCGLIPIRIFYYKDYGSGIGVQPTTNTNALLSGSAFAWRYANADVMSTSAGLSAIFISFLNINTSIVDDEIREAYTNGRAGKGVPMFFSAGNDDVADVLWPADLPTTIAVGASTMCDERKNPSDCSNESWGSSYGHTLDIVAPGVKIASTDLSNSDGYSNTNYTYDFNGTSAACPNAAAVGALILSVNNSLHARDVKAILNITAEKVGNYVYDSTTIHGSWNIEMGHGRINAFEAVNLAGNYQSTVNVNAISSLKPDFMLYPNPTTYTLYIKNTSSTILELDIYSILGQFMDKIIVEVARTSSYEFDKRGCYIAKMKGTNNSKKIIVY